MALIQLPKQIDEITRHDAEKYGIAPDLINELASLNSIFSDRNSDKVDPDLRIRVEKIVSIFAERRSPDGFVS